MIKAAFEHRSGRVISLGRTVLAVVFLAAIWFDPSQPSRYAAQAYLLLGAYLGAATAYLALTWSNWWLEARFAPGALVVDILLFGMIVFLTEGYTSPFFTFSVFILLSAMIKWGERETAMAAAAVMLVFVAVGLAALSGGIGTFELDRFLVRGSHLLVLSALLIWFGMNMGGKRGAPARPLEGDGAEEAELPIAASLDHAIACTGAGRAVIAWWDKEEPWIELATRRGASLERQRRGFADFPELVAPQLEGRTFLFDNIRCRALAQDERRRRPLRLAEPPLDRRFAADFDLSGGLVIPFATNACAGLLVVNDVPGLCSDHLPLGEHLGESISAAFDRSARIAQSQEAATAQTRLALARDLHDSVVQLLAGTAFRLEGMRKSADGGGEIGTDIDALQKELAVEQRDLRAFIGELREGDPPRRSAGLGETLADLLDRMSRQWGIRCELARCPERLFPPARLETEIQQLVREGIANAVRHGNATRVTVSVDEGERGLSLIIADNGSGLTAAEGGDKPAKPWSLNERVHQLAGDLRLSSGAGGTRITISLPFHPDTSPWQTSRP